MYNVRISSALGEQIVAARTGPSRLHGSPKGAWIRKATSSGRMRLVNQDVFDLYERVPFHARFVVHQQAIDPPETA